MSVSVEEALQLIYEHAEVVSQELIPIELALGRIVATDITATHNLPPFDNSAMDGYAVVCSDANKKVVVQHTIFAGDREELKLTSKHAMKIMTGAKVPEGCEAVVPKEDVHFDKEHVVLPERIKAGQHIRLCGEDIQSGDLLITHGTKLYAHHITLLASQGISQITVYKKPRIAVFASGSELKMHYETLGAHQIYNTNSPTFMARATELGCDVSFVGTAKDSLKSIEEHIHNALDADLIITSGGVSVGDADFTKEAFSAFGFETFFDKIDIKPGKPTTFGKIKNTLVLNLPGNPLAAALNFELFGHAIILALSGNNEKYLKPLHVRLGADLNVKAGRRTLVPGFYDGIDFKPCQKFAPGMVSPLAKSNGYIMLDETLSTVPQNSMVAMIPTRFESVGTKVIALSTTKPLLD